MKNQILELACTLLAIACWVVMGVLVITYVTAFKQECLKSDIKVVWDKQQGDNSGLYDKCSTR